MAENATLSVIIPTLNEASHLGRTLDTLSSSYPLEVIVVDGGSTDSTVAIARSHQAQVITTAPGRAQQMNSGAQVATGQMLLFLHGDTQLPPQVDQLVRRTLAQPGVVAGAFDLAIAGSGWGLRWVEWGVKLRSRWLQMPYGDQGIFLTAARFHGLGGFPDLPIMEDFVLIRRLRQQGRIAIAPGYVITSNRRWQTHGVIYTTLLNQLMILGYYVGISPQRLARWYRHWKNPFKAKG
ncbi:TIGR04283 family arsenosugar biosynthesis glycosyltransferase [Nodosilinea sp. P-1105]|uniref:TIGR04283 family arsenosugar biosynthesis glycosyltransferase n=1 Tax=Nodosilinea sp. P-1105 TaxID=2546229 RepID=UPI00146A1883|nr:TIGR04283 family arsenosugar biosynthesis glycosyltransferase [Nodosilinea sp. P-1105]NMF85354.1 glycosyltransferase [Nodosilinea sp. P-1105]